MKRITAGSIKLLNQTNLKWNKRISFVLWERSIAKKRLTQQTLTF